MVRISHDPTFFYFSGFGYGLIIFHRSSLVLEIQARIVRYCLLIMSQSTHRSENFDLVLFFTYIYFLFFFQELYSAHRSVGLPKRRRVRRDGVGVVFRSGIAVTDNIFLRTRVAEHAAQRNNTIRLQSW